jgi:hypothetical protein
MQWLPELKLPSLYQFRKSIQNNGITPLSINTVNRDMNKAVKS